MADCVKKHEQVQEEILYKILKHVKKKFPAIF